MVEQWWKDLKIEEQSLGLLGELLSKSDTPELKSLELKKTGDLIVYSVCHQNWEYLRRVVIPKFVNIELYFRHRSVDIVSRLVYTLNQLIRHILEKKGYKGDDLRW